MNVRGTAIMDSRGVFQGAQVVPIIGEDAATAAAQALLARMSASPAEQPQQEKKEGMPDLVIRALLALTPKKPERRAERDTLVSELIAANERARTLIKVELDEAYDLLVQEHAECRARGRAQEKIVGDALGKLAEAQQEINRTDEMFSKRRTELEIAKQESAGLPRFSTDDERDKADDKVRKCEERVEKSSKAHAEAAIWRNHLALSVVPPEREKLNALVVELNRLEALLAGASVESAERLRYGFVR